MDAPKTIVANNRPAMGKRGDAQKAISLLDMANSVEIQVGVKLWRSRVTLPGYIRSEKNAPAIEQAVRAIRGTRSVVRQLVDDSSLVRRLSTALASFTYTQTIPSGHQVVSSLRRVTAVGVRSDETRVATNQVCSSTGGASPAEIRSIGNPPQAQMVGQPARNGR